MVNNCVVQGCVVGTAKQNVTLRILANLQQPTESESESESESEIFIRSFQTQETSAKTITGRCRRGHLEK